MMCATLEIETPSPQLWEVVGFLIHWQIVCIYWTERIFLNRNVVSERWFMFVGKTVILLWNTNFHGFMLLFGRAIQWFDPIQSTSTVFAVEEHHALLECLVDLRVLRPETFSASIHRSLGYLWIFTCQPFRSPKSPDHSLDFCQQRMPWN